jgi:PAS domain S-box-containing protein
VTGAHLATFLIQHRSRIDALMNAQLGGAPDPASAEAELLRRFRSCAAAALASGRPAEPALEGLRVHDRRAAALLDGWIHAASAAGAPHGEAIESALRPLQQAFVARLRQSTGVRQRAKGTARAKRRAISAAIDRVADGFLALDANSGQIVDANPAAGALLGVARDALLGVDAMAFVPSACQASWWIELDAMTEGSEPRRFESALVDNRGREITVACSVTRFATRERTLALVLARPV